MRVSQHNKKSREGYEIHSLGNWYYILAEINEPVLVNFFMKHLFQDLQILTNIKKKKN